jgi:uncharacterized metal-binding protein
MENNELNNKILKNVRNKIVVSNLEKEYAMKISKRKQIISLCATTIILLSGSFLTVNAATEGKLVEDIKEKYKEIITIDYDKSKYKLTEMKEEKMSNGDNTVTYTLMSEDGEEQIDTIVNIDNLEQEHLKITAKDIEEDRENGYQLIIEDK